MDSAVCMYYSGEFQNVLFISWNMHNNGQSSIKLFSVLLLRIIDLSVVTAVACNGGGGSVLATFATFTAISIGHSLFLAYACIIK